MLSFLKISDLAILEEVSIEPAPGLNVLTGETGAGKSILVDAIGLLLGGPAAADLIRTGCERLVVEGQFELSDRPRMLGPLRDAGFDADPPEQLVIRREQPANGRGRAQVNGRTVPLAALRSLGEALADLHGQHEHQSLVRAEGQRDALDHFAGTLDLRERVASHHARVRALEREAQAIAGREEDRETLEVALRHQIAEIDSAAPHPGEEADLRREESLLRHAGEVARLAGEAFSLLSDADDAAIARLAAAGERLRKLSTIDPRAGELASLVEEARLSAAEAATDLARYGGIEGLDPARLEHVAARLAQLARLKHRFGPELDDVIQRREQAATQLAALGVASETLQRVKVELEAAAAQYAGLAGDLSHRRLDASGRLARAVRDELAALAMEGARLEIVVRSTASDQPTAHGTDAIEYLIAPNPGEEPRPLARIASGGELSRLMLALRNAAGGGDRRTLIFDEVDSGIGGRVAEMVGQRLAAISRGQQVLCVTHLPQIAAFADRHFRVTKVAAGARTRAEVRLLDADGRVEELARMLGDTPHETARRHAAAMVKMVRASMPAAGSGGGRSARGRGRATP